MDIVPPGRQLTDGTWKDWHSDPYRLHRDGDVIVGRGVTDDQQAIVSSVFAARALVENGVRPAHPVKLLFVADEETGSEYGLYHVLREHADLFSAPDGILVPDAGSEDSADIEVAEKSVLWLEFRVRGRQAHASQPDKAVNAFRAASSLVCVLDEELHVRFDGADELFDPPNSTFEPTRHEANVPNVNTIPGEDVFCFDCRILPGRSTDDVLGVVRDVCKRMDEQMQTRTTVGVRHRRDAPAQTPADAPVVRVLGRAIERVYDVAPRTIGVGGWTVASPFRERGLQAAVWMTTSETAHQPDESCSISAMAGDARVFAQVFRSELPGSNP